MPGWEDRIDYSVRLPWSTKMKGVLKKLSEVAVARIPDSRSFGDCLFEFFSLLLCLFDDILNYKHRYFGVMRNPSSKDSQSLVCFLKVTRLPDLTSSNPLDLRISMTLRCRNGRSFAMENTFRHENSDVWQGNGLQLVQIWLWRVWIFQVLRDQVGNVFPHFFFRFSLSSDI